MITGQKPMESAARARNDPMVPAVEAGDTRRYSTALLKAIDWALAPAEELRPQNVARFRESLTGIGLPQGSEAPTVLAGAPTQIPPTASPQPSSISSTVFDRALLTDLIAAYNRDAEMPILRRDGGVLMRLPGTDDMWWMAIDLDTDGVSGADLARAEMLAREQAWRFIAVLRRHPGFERARIAATGPQLGIRETRRPRSWRDVTAADGLAGRRDVAGIARASWPMEVHEAPGRSRFVAIGGERFFDVPLDALRAEGCDNLFLAGRVIGADAEAYGSVRVMGTAFATGQAAGVAAARLAAGNATDAKALRDVLAGQGAIV
jgi:hypothetical protein